MAQCNRHRNRHGISSEDDLKDPGGRFYVASQRFSSLHKVIQTSARRRLNWVPCPAAAELVVDAQG
jgi:hypothetical protein